MRRYRFGRIAAPLAGLYVVAVVASGAVALVTGDPSLLRRLAVGTWGSDLIPSVWWVELVVVAAGLVRGWALWQVLRGRRAGEPGRRGGAAGWLRAALYASAGLMLLDRLPIPGLWWPERLGVLLQGAVVWLWFRVLKGVIPPGRRILALVAGMLSVVLGAAGAVVAELDLAAPAPLMAVVVNREPFRLVWLAVILAAQARDPRWSRATVGIGVFAAVAGHLLPTRFLFASFGLGVDPAMLVVMVVGVLGLSGVVWEARSAHELGGPPPEPSSKPSPARERVPARPWPLAAVAVLLPLVPAAVDLARGSLTAVGRGGAVEGFVRAHASVTASAAWGALDVLVGVGAPAVLVLVAVLRGRRGPLRATIWTLVAVAVLCALSAVVPEAAPAEGEPAGISPLWFGLALAASALVLAALYATAPNATALYGTAPNATAPNGTAPVRRSRRRVLLAALAAAVTLVLVPAADQQRGTFTTAGDCASPNWWEQDREKELPPRTGARAFVCRARAGSTLAYRDTASDQVLLAHGRRLCGVYTRRDPAELDRLRTHEKLGPDDLESVLKDICPAAAAAWADEEAADERAFAEFKAEERRKCAATPRHRPLIKPFRAVVLEEPRWTEVGLEMIDELSGEENGTETRRGRVSSSPGYLSLYLSPEFHVCVTLETYARRPPVETEGWEEVVEVGYLNASGEMTLMDGLSGIVLPDLSLGGRQGHYRVRVHFAWFPWKGERLGTQRLLVMAYPAPGDKVVTYRGRRR
ncbi:hypothetical protein [Nonomuraea rhodomycinica]|uniref:Uncharacterized protein n=1 Tax=Nonomuraea rhodomycinica TaxID=1712872 RepID=A0A7Y6MCN5_9ACTN|nr:hypothetical protein [Nonomuraea rhodomycinica]NUW41941.1 hypothetical protein [Nonomuraea rhodomycinica]